MPISRTVGEDELLFGNIDKVNIIHIDNQTTSEPDEKLGIVRELFPDEVFNLPELEGYKSGPPVSGHDIGIVSVGRDKHETTRRDPEEFRALGEYYLFACSHS